MLAMSDEVSILKKHINKPTVDQEEITKWIGRINQDNLSLDEVDPEDGKAVIHHAIEQGLVEVVRDLIAAGASVNDIGAKSPLLTAVEAGQPEIVAMLLSDEAQANPEGAQNDPQSPLYCAVNAGQTKIVDKLLGAGANPNGIRNDPHTPLYRAAEKGDITILKSLLVAGAGVNDCKLSLLFSPLNGSPRQTTKYALVLCNGTDDNQNLTKSWKLRIRGRNGAFAEIDLTHIERYEELLALLETVNPLHIEAINRNLLFKLKVEKLFCKLSYTVFPNLSYANNARPLHIACQLGHVDVVKMLIDHGADPITPDEQGNTPLRRAIANAASWDNTTTTAIFSLLLQEGAGFGVPDLKKQLEGQGLFGKFGNLGPVMVIGTGLTRKDPGFQDAITNLEELEEWLMKYPVASRGHFYSSYNSQGLPEPTEVAKFATKYLELCNHRLKQVQSDKEALNLFSQGLCDTLRKMEKTFESNRLKSCIKDDLGILQKKSKKIDKAVETQDAANIQEKSNEIDEAVEAQNAANLQKKSNEIDKVVETHNAIMKHNDSFEKYLMFGQSQKTQEDDKLNETFRQLMDQLMELQTYLQDDEGLKNRATWDYRGAKMDHYSPLRIPLVLAFPFVMLLGYAIYALVKIFTQKTDSGGDYVGNLSTFWWLLGILGPGVGLFGGLIMICWFGCQALQLSSSDNTKYDDSKNQLPVSPLDVIQQAGLETIQGLLDIFMDDKLITSGDMQALRDAKTLSELGNAINAIYNKRGDISKPGFTYSEKVKAKYREYQLQTFFKPADTVLELEAESSASESYGEDDPLFSAGDQIPGYGAVGNEPFSLVVDIDESNDSDEVSSRSEDEENSSKSVGLING